MVLILIAGAIFAVQQNFFAPTERVYGQEELFDVLTWQDLIDGDGADAAREEYLRATKPVTPAEQHITAHAFGRALYERFGAEGLRYCGLEYTGGCIHEMIARDFLDKEDPLSSASQCADFATPIACEHSLGHGFIAFYGYEEEGLRQALAMCADIGAEELIHGCTYGVIMEYYFRNLQGPLVSEPDDSNAYELCDSFEGVARRSCFYNISTLWFLRIEDDADIERPFFRIAEKCWALPDKESDREDCARGVGRSIGSLGTIARERRIQMCNDVYAVEPIYLQACTETIKQFRSLWGELR